MRSKRLVYVFHFPKDLRVSGTKIIKIFVRSLQFKEKLFIFPLDIDLSEKRQPEKGSREEDCWKRAAMDFHL